MKKAKEILVIGHYGLICKALDIPYEELFNTYDKELSDEQKKYGYIKYISYNQVPVFADLNGFIECPSEYAKVSFAYKVPDDKMAPALKKDDTAFVEIAGLLENKDIGLFDIDGEFVIRRFLYRKNDIILRAEDKDVEDIKVSDLKNFKVIGKIYK